MKKLILVLGLLLFILPVSFAAEIRVFLQSADNETLDDTYTDTSDTVVNGASANLNIFGVGSDRIRAWLTFNMSPVIDQCSSINGANLSLKCTDGSDCGISATDRVFEVNTSSPNGAWQEDIIHGGNNPCGTVDYNNGAVCNQSTEHALTVNSITWWNWTVTAMVKKAFNENRKNVSMNINNDLTDNQHQFHSKEAVTAANRPILYVYCEAASSSPDTTPPIITNFSNQGSSCTNWNTNRSNPCSTSDTTPSLYFNTSENAFCAIGINNLNYTTMGSSRNCTSGEGTTEHACDLKLQDELAYEDSIVYLSCKDASGNENITSTSDPLSLTITGLESAGDMAIGIGVQNALLSGYTNYTTQQIYARNLAGQQDYGTFDWFVKKGSKAWAFNYVTKGEENVLLFNLTPTLYVLEMSNITATNITKYVEAVINTTK